MNNPENKKLEDEKFRIFKKLMKIERLPDKEKQIKHLLDDCNEAQKMNILKRFLDDELNFVNNDKSNSSDQKKMDPSNIKKIQETIFNILGQNGLDFLRKLAKGENKDFSNKEKPNIKSNLFQKIIDSKKNNNNQLGLNKIMEDSKDVIEMESMKMVPARSSQKRIRLSNIILKKNSSNSINFGINKSEKNIEFKEKSNKSNRRRTINFDIDDLGSKNIQNLEAKPFNKKIEIEKLLKKQNQDRPKETIQKKKESQRRKLKIKNRKNKKQKINNFENKKILNNLNNRIASNKQKNIGDKLAHRNISLRKSNDEQQIQFIEPLNIDFENTFGKKDLSKNIKMVNQNLMNSGIDAYDSNIKSNRKDILKNLRNQRKEDKLKRKLITKGENINSDPKRKKNKKFDIEENNPFERTNKEAKKEKGAKPKNAWLRRNRSQSIRIILAGYNYQEFTDNLPANRESTHKNKGKRRKMSKTNSFADIKKQPDSKYNRRFSIQAQKPKRKRFRNFDIDDNENTIFSNKEKNNPIVKLQVSNSNLIDFNLNPKLKKLMRVESNGSWGYIGNSKSSLFQELTEKDKQVLDTALNQGENQNDLNLKFTEVKRIRRKTFNTEMNNKYIHLNNRRSNIPDEYISKINKMTNSEVREIGKSLSRSNMLNFSPMNETDLRSEESLDRKSILSLYLKNNAGTNLDNLNFRKKSKSLISKKQLNSERADDDVFSNISKRSKVGISPVIKIMESSFNSIPRF